MEIIFIIARVILGLFFIHAGVGHFLGFKNMVGYSQSKKVPLPAVAVAVTGAMLILGGLGFVIWQWVCLASLILVVFLIPAAFIMHNFWNEQDPNQKVMQKIQFLKNIALAAAVAIIAVMYNGIGIL